MPVRVKRAENVKSDKKFKVGDRVRVGGLARLPGTIIGYAHVEREPRNAIFSTYIGTNMYIVALDQVLWTRDQPLSMAQVSVREGQIFPA